MNGTKLNNQSLPQFELCKTRNGILAADGHVLIVGGAGSGKTTIALLKARRAVEGGLSEGQSVLFLSFSNSAIHQIKQRSEHILVGGSDRHVDIRTYHSFCWDVLRSHGYLLSDRRSLSVVGSHDADVRKAGLSSKTWVAEQEKLFVEEGLITYDLFAPMTASLFDRCPRLLSLYTSSHPIIFVDEFQDTDADQWRLVRLLANKSVIVALGDRWQRIYDWRPGVSTKRLDEFGETLEPQVFDLGSENNRSPDTGIAHFAHSLVLRESELRWCEEVKCLRFPPGNFGLAVKLAVLGTINRAQRFAGRKEVTVAISGRSNHLVRLISDALSETHTYKSGKLRPVAHDVLIDQTQILLSARVVAYLLETPNIDRRVALASCLDLIVDLHRSSGNKTGIQTADRIAKWSSQVRTNPAYRRTKLVVALESLLESLTEGTFLGAPIDDWVLVRRMIGQSGVKDLSKVAGYVRHLRLLRRGSSIAEGLAGLWRTQNSYLGAVAAVDGAILRDQIVDAVRPPARCTVMTMYKLKAREYDGSVLIEDEHRRFLVRDDEPPYDATRRLLGVAVTRARHSVTIVLPKGDNTLALLGSR